ncbi:MAG TPA: phosphotransferase [Nevskiaceae bacterium]|nr:phosphotransferase [Nevskiaceae bacterium]
MKLHQDAQFTPTRHNVALLLSRYGLEITGYELADSGIENCTVIVQATQGKYALRVYRRHKKSDGDIQKESDFVTYLADNEIPVAPPIKNLDGEDITHLEDSGHIWQAILMQHMPGSHAEHYSGVLMTSLATVQARMHTLAASYATDKRFGQNITELREAPFIKLIADRAALDSSRRSFVSRAENYLISLDEDLPSGLCHLDFGNGNVLSSNGTVTAVLDFDDLAQAPYVMCLAYTLWDIVYDLDLSGIAPYIKTYEEYRPLRSNEKSLLQPLMLFRHYMIGCISIAGGHMDNAEFEKHLSLESKLLGH